MVVGEVRIEPDPRLPAWPRGRLPRSPEISKALRGAGRGIRRGEPGGAPSQAHGEGGGDDDQGDDS